MEFRGCSAQQEGWMCIRVAPHSLGQKGGNQAELSWSHVYCAIIIRQQLHVIVVFHTHDAAWRGEKYIHRISDNPGSEDYPHL